MKWPTCKKLLQDPDQLIKFLNEYHPAMTLMSKLVIDFNNQKDSKLVDMDGNSTAITDFNVFLRIKLDNLS